MYKKIMTVEAFLKILKDIQKNKKTVYVYGAIGQIVTNSLLSEKAKQYPGFYTATKKAQLKNYVGKGYYGFDCVNVIKSILWGWNGDTSKTYCGAKYASNTVPDVSANGFINLCENPSTNFATIKIGEAVWLSGHIGIYIGNGLVIECSPRWKNNVQITACGNIGTIRGYNTRKWTKHAKIPWLIYETTKPESISYFKSCDSREVSIVNALVSQGYSGTMDYRKKVAAANNIESYSGSYSQNSQLLEKMKNGKLLKP